MTETNSTASDTLRIDHLPLQVHEHELTGKESDSLVFTSEQRRWVRGRFTTRNGRDIALALSTGAVLEPGSILWIGPDWYLTVEAAPESVLRISPRDSQSAIRIAFEVGNRHFPLAIDRHHDCDTLLVPDDPAMVQLLDRIGVAWERCQAVFRPVGHAHGHEH